MNDRAALALRIAVNLDAMRKSMGEAGSLIQSTTKQMEKMAASLRGDQLQASALKAMAGIQALGGAVKLTANEAQRYEQLLSKAIDKARVMGQQTNTAMVQMRDSLRKVADQGEKTNGIFSTMGAKLTAAFGAGMLIDRAVSSLMNFGRQAVQSAGDIKDMSLRLGVSTDAVQEWTFAAKQSGASMDDVSRAVTQMNDRLAGGGQSTIAALEKAGLQFAQIRAMKPEEAFNAITQAIQNIRDPMIQTQVAMDLFGKSGAEMLAAIKEGINKHLELAPKMSKATIEGLDAAEDEWGAFFDQITVWTGTAIAKLREFQLWAHMKGTWTEMLQAAGGDIFPDVPGATLRSRSGASPSVDVAQAIESGNRATDAVLKNLERLRAAEEKYLAFVRQRITGMTDAQRQEEAWVQRMLRGTQALDIRVQSMKEFLATQKAINVVLPDMGRANLPGALNIGSGESQYGRGASLIAPLADMRVWKAVGDNARAQLKSAALAFPQMLANAIINGQGLGQALRGFAVQLGGEIGANIGRGLDTLTANAGGLLGKLSGAFSGMMSAGVSIAIDLAIKGITKLIDHFGGNVTRVAREGLASSLGFASLAALYDKLEGIGQGGLARQGRSGIGRNDSAGNEAWMRRVEVALRAFTAAMDSAETQLSSFGMKAPAALRPMIADLLKSTQLTDGLRAQLLEMSSEASWEEQQEQAEKYGVSIAALGSGFQRLKSHAQASDLFAFFENAREGGDSAGILTGLSDELQDLIDRSLQFGTSLPEFLRPMIEQAQQLGLVTADFARLKFEDIASPFDRMADVLEQIRDLLANGIPQAARAAGNAVGNNLPGMTMPVNGSNYGYRTSPVGGGQGVLGGGMSGAQIHVHTYLDGREVAEVIVPYIPGEAGRYGVGVA